MNESTPEDLATFFRSVPRRLREAMGDAEPSSVAGLVSDEGDLAGAVGEGEE